MDIARLILEDMIKDSDVSKNENHHIFQYRVNARYNTNKTNKGDVVEAIKWIKENYDHIIDLCYFECKALEHQSMIISEEEFKENIEPILLDFENVTDPSKYIIIFNVGNVIKGKNLSVYISKNNEIGEIVLS